MKKLLSISSLLFVLTTIPSSNCLGSQSDDEGFLQHIFYEMLGSNPEPVENRTEEKIDENETGNEIQDRKSKVVSPTLVVDVPPPFKEYARMARYVVHNSGE